MRSRAHLELVPNEDVDADQRKDAPERWQDAIQDVVRCIRARRLPPRRVGHSVRREEEDFGALCRVAQPSGLLMKGAISMQSADAAELTPTATRQ